MSVSVPFGVTTIQQILTIELYFLPTFLFFVAIFAVVWRLAPPPPNFDELDWSYVASNPNLSFDKEDVY